MLLWYRVTLQCTDDNLYTRDMTTAMLILLRLHSKFLIVRNHMYLYPCSWFALDFETKFGLFSVTHCSMLFYFPHNTQKTGPSLATLKHKALRDSKWSILNDSAIMLCNHCWQCPNLCFHRFHIWYFLLSQHVMRLSLETGAIGFQLVMARNENGGMPEISVLIGEARWSRLRTRLKMK